MKYGICFGAMCIILLLNSCIPVSIYPFYKDTDVIYNPTLIGTWAMNGGNEQYMFEQSDSASYTLSYKRDGQVSEFDANLFRVGDGLCLDIYPRDPGVTLDEMFRNHLIPVHSFYRVIRLDSNLVMSTFDVDWLKEVLRMNAKVPSHLPIDDKWKLNRDFLGGIEIVFTAPTTEIQTFIMNNLNNEEAFSEPGVLKRVDAR